MTLKFSRLSEIADEYGFAFEREGSGFVLFSNQHAPGTEGVYGSLREAWQDIALLTQNVNPLSQQPLPVK